MLQCKGSSVGECWRCTERVSVCEAEICHRPVGMRSISRGAGAETLDPMASWYLLVSVGCMINIDKLLTFWSCEYAFQKKPFKEAKVWLQFASLELIWIDMNWSLSESMPCGKSTSAVKSWKSLVMWRNAHVHMSHCKDQLFNGAIHSINGPSPCQSRVLTCWNLRCGFLMLFTVWQYSLQLQSQCRFPMYRVIDLRNHFMAVLVCWSRTKRKNLSVLAPPGVISLSQLHTNSLYQNSSAEVFCPFDQKQKLIAKGLLRVLEVIGQASVKLLDWNKYIAQRSRGNLELGRVILNVFELGPTFWGEFLTFLSLGNAEFRQA